MSDKLFGTHKFKILILTLFLLAGALGNTAEAAEQKRIGILVDGPYWHNEPLINQVKEELEKVNDGQFKILYPKKFHQNGQYDFNKIEHYARELAGNDELDTIISVGTVSSYLFSKMDPLPIPVVAMDYILPAGLGMLSPKTFKPLNPNWTTSFDPTYVNETLKIFPKLVHADRFVVLCPDVLCGFNAKIPELIESFVGKPAVNMKVEIISTDNYEDIINNLKAPLVVVETLKGFTNTQMEDLYKRLSDRKILAFTVDGMNGIEKGALVSIHDYATERIGRNIALKLFDILDGTLPSQIPVIDFKSAEIIFNRETARKIGYEIPLELADEARLYGSSEEYPELSFENSIDRALEQNFDIKTQALVNNQAMLQVEINERGFYPQISSSLGYNRTNDAQADALGGPRGETRFDLTLEQKLYDRQLSKSIESAEATLKEKEQNLERINQNIIEQVALAYMDNLQGEELVEIQRNYLNIIRKNQTLADLKFKLGETGKSDVLRLNIELDNARINLMDAKEARFRALVRLNNLMNHSRETKHKYEFQSFSAKGYKTRAARFSKFLRSAEQLKVFRNFFNEQALTHSPDLKVLLAGLNQAQVEKERLQSRYYPSARLEAGYFNQIQNERQSLSASDKQAFEDRFGEGWQAQLKLEFPLFLGGARSKQVDQANVHILELESSINSVKNVLSERSRAGLFNVFRSRRNLDFALRNVISSQENLKLAEVAYLEGDFPVIDLLDSQSRLILSKTNAVRTRYQFYKNLFSLLRDVGRVDLIKNFNRKEELGAFLSQVEQYFIEHAPGSSLKPKQSTIE